MPLRRPLDATMLRQALREQPVAHLHCGFWGNVWRWQLVQHPQLGKAPRVCGNGRCLPVKIAPKYPIDTPVDQWYTSRAMATTTVRVTDEQRDWLHQQATKRRMTIAEFIAYLISRDRALRKLERNGKQEAQ